MSAGAGAGASAGRGRRALGAVAVVGASMVVAAATCHTEAPAGGAASPSASASGTALEPTAHEDDGGMRFLFADAEPLADPPPSATAMAPTSEARLAPFGAAVPVKAKSIGHTSVVFRVDFASGVRAAYKPESKRGHKRFRGEVAAYRLAKILKLPNVPSAMVRVMPRAALRAAAEAGGDKALALFDDEVIDRSGRVFGALMPWIDKLEFYPLESPAQKALWTAWLENGHDIPADERNLAAQISTLLVFDALTANWDRWSGGNVAIDRPSDTLLFVDNDAAFQDPPPAAPLAAQMALVRRCDRFSHALVVRLRALDPVSLADGMGDEESGTPLLSAHTLADVDQRRKDVLAIVTQKMATLGEAAVLYFP